MSYCNCCKTKSQILERHERTKRPGTYSEDKEEKDFPSQFLFHLKVKGVKIDEIKQLCFSRFNEKQHIRMIIQSVLFSLVDFEIQFCAVIDTSLKSNLLNISWRLENFICQPRPDHSLKNNELWKVGDICSIQHNYWREDEWESFKKFFSETWQLNNISNNFLFEVDKRRGFGNVLGKKLMNSLKTSITFPNCFISTKEL